MKVLLVLPNFPVTPRELRRCRESLVLELQTAVIDLAASDADMSLASIHGERVEVYDPERALRSWDRVAFIEKDVGRAALLQSRSTVPVYRFNFALPSFRARILTVKSTDNCHNPQLSAHLFNRLAPGETDVLYFFPHGYLYRQLGVGPLNEFGHRIGEPLDVIARRDANVRLIAIFGGSATWSPECLHNEMFSSRLEDKLNQQALLRGSPLRFIVLNFGQHGNVVLNELQTFTIFCMALHPEVVIAHDGYNDFVYGLTNDPNLLARHNIAYQDVMELWSPILHKSWDLTAVRTRKETFKVRNTAEAIIRAYWLRKLDFERVVTNLGSHFIWGLQPFLGSKQAPSKSERGFIESRQQDEREVQRLFYPTVPLLYEAFTSKTGWENIEHRVDCHKAFSALGPEGDHFVDHVHCSPEGDDVIADCYSNYLVSHFFSR